MLTIICALAANRAIGYQNKLLYHLSADLRRFKTLTTGHTIIMGRRTFESLPKGALPNRRNIVLTRQEGLSFEGTEVFPSLQAALDGVHVGVDDLEAGVGVVAACEPEEDIYIIGGESVYAEALPMADRLCLTHVEATPEHADAFFPEFDPMEWRLTDSESHEADEKNAVPYTFADYERL